MKKYIISILVASVFLAGAPFAVPKASAADFNVRDFVDLLVIIGVITPDKLPAVNAFLANLDAVNTITSSHSTSTRLIATSTHSTSTRPIDTVSTSTRATSTRAGYIFPTSTRATSTFESVIAARRATSTFATSSHPIPIRATSTFATSTIQSNANGRPLARGTSPSVPTPKPANIPLAAPVCGVVHDTCTVGAYQGDNYQVTSVEGVKSWMWLCWGTHITTGRAGTQAPLICKKEVN